VYLSVIIWHTFIPNLSRSKIFILRSFRSLSLNGIWLNQNPTMSPFGAPLTDPPLFMSFTRLIGHWVTRHHDPTCPPSPIIVPRPSKNHQTLPPFLRLSLFFLSHSLLHVATSTAYVPHPFLDPTSRIWLSCWKTRVSSIECLPTEASLLCCSCFHWRNPWIHGLIWSHRVSLCTSHYLGITHKDSTLEPSPVDPSKNPVLIQPSQV
jgi:hypothetical protein